MKKTEKIKFKNATIENNKITEIKVKKSNGVEYEETVFECGLDELYDKIDKMGEVKVTIGSESPMSSEQAKKLISMYDGKYDITLDITSESDEEL